MIARFLIARIRRQHVDANGYCAMWVACRYIEPFGDPCWAVCVHSMYGDEREVGRAKWLWLAAWRAWRAHHRTAGSLVEGVA